MSDLEPGPDPNRSGPGAALARRVTICAAVVGLLSGCATGDGASTAAPTVAPPSSTTVAPPSTTTTTAVDPEAACDRIDPVAEIAAVDAEGLIEASGLVASRNQPGVFWTHNDGPDPRLFALDAGGALLGVVEVTGAELVDWEDLAIGPGPDGADQLYLADTGDNAGTRDLVSLYRVPEPGPGDGVVAVGARIDIDFPERRYNVEALLIDPRDGEAVLISKAPPSGDVAVVLSVAPQTGSAVVDAVVAGTIDTEALADPADPLAVLGGLPHLVTAADASADGATIAVRTYGSVLLWTSAGDGDIATTLTTTRPCVAPARLEPQGEAIALTEDGYVTISEGASSDLIRFGPR